MINQDSEIRQSVLKNYTTMILQELESINLQKELIEMYSKQHYNLSNIIVNEARLGIDQSKEAIKTFMELKKKNESFACNQSK